MQRPQKLRILLASLLVLTAVTSAVLIVRHDRERSARDRLLQAAAHRPTDPKEIEPLRRAAINAWPQLIAMMTPQSPTRLKLARWAQAARRTPFAPLVPASLARETDELQAVTAVAGFGALGPSASPAIPSLERLANYNRDNSTPNYAVQALFAIEALSLIGTNALPALTRLATTSGWPIQSVRAIISVGDGPSIEPFLADIMKGPVPSDALSYVARLYTPRAIRMLTNALQSPDPKVRKDALCWIVWQNDPAEARQAIGPLVHCLHDPDNNVQTAAALALNAIAPEMSVSNVVSH